jgi:hypothetical protein
MGGWVLSSIKSGVNLLRLATSELHAPFFGIRTMEAPAFFTNTQSPSILNSLGRRTAWLPPDLNIFAVFTGEAPEISIYDTYILYLIRGQPKRGTSISG